MSEKKGNISEIENVIMLPVGGKEGLFDYTLPLWKRPLSSLLVKLFPSGPLKRFYLRGSIGVLSISIRVVRFHSSSILKPTSKFAYA